MRDLTSDQPGVEPKTLLVVDDTPENLTILGEMLMPRYRVRLASSGAQALMVARTHPLPDLILLDVMMPDMDGYDVLERLQNDTVTREIPVIFVTALDGINDEARGLEMGAVDYILKPIKPAIVHARVHTHLELKEARDRLKDQNAWLDAEVQRRMRQNLMVQDVAMRALACLAEVRDNETGAHILRTQNYVRVLAEELAKDAKYRTLLTPKLIESYTKAAPLHDLGKVGIPDPILHKPGKLTAEEWETMKTHSRLGADAIWRAIKDEEDRQALDFLYIAMEIAHYHHEKWDGSGYPEGLRGEAIPLPARLMALADVFDALITRRVYKPPFSIKQSIQIIQESRSTHFDPDIVDAFLRRLDDFRQIAGQFNDEYTQDALRELANPK